MLIHEKIKILREDNGWTVEELAEKLGLPSSVIESWESGMNIYSVENIRDLAQAFRVDADVLYNDKVDIM